MRGSGGYFLYWMPKAQRLELNHAPEYAAQKANELGQRPFSSPTDAGAYEKYRAYRQAMGNPRALAATPATARPSQG